ncbi:MAG: radical SAM protein [Bryobacteraceae bacterium]|nr:radical SAM protein [Bryobacteraceae bacterium]
MRTLNRWRILWAYLAKRTRLGAIPVEYIVETTAKCNIYCPMCPRETHPQPKEDMPQPVFERLVADSRRSAEHMMLIGLGEPFLDKAIFDRIEFCERHGISTLLSTNGTLLDEAAARRLLDSPIEHVTLSMDSMDKETYEFYRKGAKFERVRDNFLRFCELKHQMGAKVQVVVQMVRMDRNRHEEADFIRFWSAVPGVDAVRVKEDETDLMRADTGHTAEEWKHPCHYLWRGPMYVKHNGDVYPCCQSYMLDGAPVGNVAAQSLREIADSDAMVALREAHISGRAGEIEMCAKCRTTIPHPVMVAGSLLMHGRWVRRLLPWIERLGRRWMKPPQVLTKREELVQIGK